MRGEPDERRYTYRRYTYGGQVAHLLPFTSGGHYALARCGYAPSWPAEWLGSGSQGERDEAERLRKCSRCTRMAEVEAAHRETSASAETDGAA